MQIAPPESAASGVRSDSTDVADLDVTVDRLTSCWSIVQRRRGHRHSTDDLLTAWYAVEKTARRSRVLDLGTGIGSVALLVLWRSPDATVVAIEAQEQSYRLLCKNIEQNGLGARIRPMHGDLRWAELDAASFDLVTGSPPYFDVKDGIVSADSQRAHARFELRGDVRDYCAAARRAMAKDARFVFCFPWVQRARAERACADGGLAVVTSRDVVPRIGAKPLFSLFSCCRDEDSGSGVEPLLEPPYVVRDERGDPTEEHVRSRASFGMA